MKPAATRFIALSLLAGAGSLFISVPSLAQSAPVATSASASAPLPPASSAIAPVMPSSSALPPPVPTSVAAPPLPAIVPSGRPTAAPPPAPAPLPPPTVTVEAAPKWYDVVDVLAFVDAYGAFNYRMPKPQSPSSAAPSGGTAGRAWDGNNGFSLSWVGLDLSVPAAPVGATINLRYSPYSAAYAGFDGTAAMQNVKQAFATYRPGGEKGKFYLDFGKFDTIVGAESTNSWENHNYSRGLLYTFAQPLFHVGAKATYEANEKLAFVLMAVNGWNLNVDNNLGKSIGAQVRLSPSEDFKLSLSYFGGPEQADYTTVALKDNATARADRAGNNKRFRHLLDFVAAFKATKRLSFVVNADYGTERAITSSSDAPIETERFAWYGAMAGARFAFNDTFAAAVRGEVYYDPQGYSVSWFGSAPDADALRGKDHKIQSGTLTLEALPTENLVIRLENRYDHSNQSLFPFNVRGQDNHQFTTTLGVVVRSK